jgi:hypothetical protein
MGRENRIPQALAVIEICGSSWVIYIQPYQHTEKTCACDRSFLHMRFCLVIIGIYAGASAPDTLMMTAMLTDQLQDNQAMGGQ